MKLSGKGKTNYFTASKFKKYTCLFCGREKHYDCGISEDGGLAYCKFTANQDGRKDALGRYLYILGTDNKGYLMTSPKPKQAAKDNSVEAVKADADVLDAVYSAFLEDLQLNEGHSNNLLERGLNDSEIVLNLYASVPTYDKRFEIPRHLSKRFNLENIPGFYLKNGCWCLSMCSSADSSFSYAGFYIPYRDEKGRITGLQIRRDKYLDNKDKYMWLSSKDKEKGASSGSPLHFVNVEAVKASKDLYLTEGVLKADIIASKSEVGLVASAGAGSKTPEKLLDEIFTVYPDLERIVIAYDMDWQTNGNVHSALGRLLNALKTKDVEVFVATWNLDLGKGLDDVLINPNLTDGDIQYIPINEFQSVFDAVIFSTESENETDNIFESIPVDEPNEINNSMKDINFQDDFDNSIELEEVQVEADCDGQEKQEGKLSFLL